MFTKDKVAINVSKIPTTVCVFVKRIFNTVMNVLGTAILRIRKAYMSHCNFMSLLIAIDHGMCVYRKGSFHCIYLCAHIR